MNLEIVVPFQTLVVEEFNTLSAGAVGISLEKDAT